MGVRIIHGSALELPLADDSVDLVVTSPPYFSLRSYTEDGAALAHQVGGEATPAEYVDALLAATREAMRVLKPSGSLWVNLGDKYAGWGNPDSNRKGTDLTTGEIAPVVGGRRSRPSRTEGVPNKSLMGLPWRYALACIDQLGLILRAEVVWDKPNGLPESVRDRVRRSHEQWFHFTLSPRYYANVDEVREPNSAHWEKYSGRKGGTKSADTRNDAVSLNRAEANPLGKLPGSVWRIATQPLRVPAELGVDHFAAFPMEWPRRIITGWSPPGICTACGEGRRTTIGTLCEKCGAFRPNNANSCGACGHRRAWQEGRKLLTVKGQGTFDGATGAAVPQKPRNAMQSTKSVSGGESCACPTPDAPTRPAVVLDPFGGTGTTALMADVLGRDGISVDLSADYCRLATWRTSDAKERLRARKCAGLAEPPRPRRRKVAEPTLPLFADDDSETEDRSA